MAQEGGRETASRGRIPPPLPSPPLSPGERERESEKKSLFLVLRPSVVGSNLVVCQRLLPVCSVLGHGFRSSLPPQGKRLCV